MPIHVVSEVRCMQPLTTLYIVDGITALLLFGGLFICVRKGLFGLFAYPAGLLACFLFEYQLFSPAYALAMRGLSGLLPILSEPSAYAAAEIVFTVVYETLIFIVIALISRRRMRFSTAGAFAESICPLRYIVIMPFSTLLIHMSDTFPFPCYSHPQYFHY